MTTNPIIREDCQRICDEMAPMLSALGGKRILITGASGFLCSYFVDLADAFNDRNPDTPLEVVALDNFISGWPKRLDAYRDNPHVRVVEHDVAKPFEPDGHVDFIVHGASIASPIYYRKHPLETIDVNVNGTWNMLRLATEHHCQGMIQLSSSEVYGDPDPKRIPTSEDYLGNVSFTGPRACYDESKRLGETLSVNYQRIHGTTVRVVRPFNVYGPGQNLKDRRIIPDLMSAAVEKRPLVLLSDGTPTRSFCYVTDQIRGILHVLLKGKPGQSYNVGNDHEISIRELAETMCDVAGMPRSEVRFEKSPDPHYLSDNPNRRCPDLTRLRALGWRPLVSLAEGLGRTLESYKV